MRRGGLDKGKGKSLYLGSLSWARSSKVLLSVRGHTQCRRQLTLPRDGLRIQAWGDGSSLWTLRTALSSCGFPELRCPPDLPTHQLCFHSPLAPSTQRSAGFWKLLNERICLGPLLGCERLSGRDHSGITTILPLPSPPFFAFLNGDSIFQQRSSVPACRRFMHVSTHPSFTHSFVHLCAHSLSFMSSVIQLFISLIDAVSHSVIQSTSTKCTEHGVDIEMLQTQVFLLRAARLGRGP